MRAARAAAAIAVVIACMPGVARAGGAGVVATSVDGDRTSVAAAVADAIGGGGQVVRDAITAAREAIAAGAVPVAELARFRQVRDAIDEAWRAYLHVSVDFAASRLAAARQDAEGLVALPGGAELYADASLRLGAVLLQQGRTDEGRAVLALALALDPERPVTLAEFPPDFVDAVAAVRAAPPAGTQHVRVASAPAGARLELDGIDRGPSPIELELGRGQHVLAARAPGYLPRALGVAVSDTTSALRIELERDDDDARLAAGIAPGAAGDAVQALVDAVVRFADLDEVALAAVVDRRGEPALRLQRCAGLPARCTPVVEIGYTAAAGLPAAAREAWAAARSAELAGPPVVFEDRATQIAEHRCRVCRSPLLWGGVLVAATLGAVAIVAAASGGRGAPVVSVSGMQFAGH